MPDNCRYPSRARRLPKWCAFEGRLLHMMSEHRQNSNVQSYRETQGLVKHSIQGTRDLIGLGYSIEVLCCSPTEQCHIVQACASYENNIVLAMKQEEILMTLLKVTHSVTWFLGTSYT